jgi:hypothetical protein
LRIAAEDLIKHAVAYPAIGGGPEAAGGAGTAEALGDELINPITRGINTIDRNINVNQSLGQLYPAFGAGGDDDAWLFYFRIYLCAFRLLAVRNGLVNPLIEAAQFVDLVGLERYARVQASNSARIACKINILAQPSAFSFRVPIEAFSFPRAVSLPPCANRLSFRAIAPGTPWTGKSGRFSWLQASRRHVYLRSLAADCAPTPSTA